MKEEPIEEESDLGVAEGPSAAATNGQDEEDKDEVDIHVPRDGSEVNE